MGKASLNAVAQLGTRGPLGKNARTALQGPLPHSTLSLPLLFVTVPRPFSPPSPPLPFYGFRDIISMI